MNDSFDEWNAFRKNESRVDAPLVCCECGKRAEGNISCDDGDVCDACHGAMETPHEVQLHGDTYSYRDEQVHCELANVQGFLKEHPVGAVYRVSVGAPGIGVVDFRVTRYTSDAVYGVEIRNTVRILTPGDVK